MEKFHKRRVALIYGGQSGEHEISCRSARFVWGMLSFSYDVFLIGITKEGLWYWQNDQAIRDEVIKIEENRLVDLRPGFGLFYQNMALNLDCAFPLVHGSHGEDGRLQALLDMIGLPYTGCSFLSSVLCTDKVLLKTVWELEKIPTLPFLTIFRYEFPLLSDDDLRSKLDFFSSFPLIVKPASGGSSLGVSKVQAFGELRGALGEALKWDFCALIEPFGNFREVECAVVGSGDAVHVYPLGEVDYGSAAFYDYEAKYENSDVRLQIPANLSSALYERIQQLAHRAYLAGRCEGFARVDFFIDRQNSDRVYVNEINTIPGFTKVSLFPQMCLASGLSLKELGIQFVEEGLARFARNQGKTLLE